MKKPFILLFILLISLSSFGQENKFGISIQVNSPSKDDIKLGWYDMDSESIDDYNLDHSTYAGGFLANYNLNWETTIRLRFGITKFFINEYRDNFTNSYHVVASNKGQQTKTQYAPGIAWKLIRRKFVLFGGFEIPVNFHHPFTMDLVSKTSDSATGAVIQDMELRVTLPRGNSFGIGAIMGFNYFPAKWLSIGAEFSPSLLYAKLSGETTLELTDFRTPSNSNINHTQDQNKGFTFYEQRFSISLSFWFGGTVNNTDRIQ